MSDCKFLIVAFKFQISYFRFRISGGTSGQELEEPTGVDKQTSKETNKNKETTNKQGLSKHGQKMKQGRESQRILTKMVDLTLRATTNSVS